MPRSHKTITFLIGLLIGIGVAPDMTYRATVLIASLAYIFFFFAFLFKKKRLYIVILVCSLGIFIGVARFEWAVAFSHVNTVAEYNDTGPFTFRGTIIDEPDVQNDSTKLTVEAFEFTSRSVWKKTTGLVLVSTGKYPEFSYDDRVEVTGSLETPEDFQGFQYKNYLARYGIFSALRNPEIKKISSSSISSVNTALISLRISIENVINRLLPEPHASFLAGLLIGSRRNIPQETLDSFQTTGITHIIAISGYNITLIVITLGALLRRARREVQVTVSIVCIGLFTVLVGASAAVVRASVMGILGLAALYFNRTTQITLQVLLAAGIMNFWNPFILRSDLGFQLSFSAVLGLVYVSPWVSGALQKIPDGAGIRESLALTISAQVLSTPLILLNFHRVSLVAPLTNLLVAPAVPLGMLAGGVLLLTFWIPVLRVVSQSAAWLVLSYMLKVAGILSHVSFASVENVEWGTLATAIWYSVVIVITYCYSRNRTYKV